ncbi:SpoIIE family protein phosphatase [Blastococcus haudaquaticus]|uniref:PAS domain S-box-containing protein n=1 Tax=Blastococcus haudaquaticus TaxID=1938745 RepID=A0A286GP71_9ACTN|nr:SpoIIE family protein phosphatase [Blastococcus haudaquaticus]SOD97320.1 PAS domain S-box-containing protein [Blastococcus haudaquaticus]
MTGAGRLGCCLLVDVSAEEVALLDDLPGRIRVSLEELADRSGTTDTHVDLVVIGSLSGSSVAAVQRAHRLVPDAAVAVLAHDSRAVRREIDFAPGVPLDVLVLAVDDVDLPGRLESLRAATVQRRQHSAVLAAVARSAGRNDETSPAGVTAVGALLEHAPLAVLVTDAAGDLVGWNRRAEDLFGLRPATSGRPVEDVVPGSGALVRSVTTSAGREAPGGASGVPLQMRLAGRVDVELSAISSQTDQGRAVVLLLAVDVTAQRRAERDRDRLVAQLELLGRVSESLMASLDPVETRSRLADVLVPSFADWTSIQLWDVRDQPGGVLVRHGDPAAAPVARQVEELKSRHGVMTEPGRRAAAGETVLLPDVGDDELAGHVPDDRLRVLVQKLGAVSLIAVPVPGRAGVLGSLLLVNGSDSPPFVEADRALAIEIGRRAGIALDNAQLYSGQRHLATELQQSLLTEPPEVDFADIAVRYVAAAEQAQVGGDWYDAFRQRNGNLVLVIGDVVGHDTHAAAAMGQLRGVVRGICFTAAETPSQLLGSVDEAIQGLQLDTMATAVLAQLSVTSDAGGARMSWSNAGHPPPVLLDAAGRARALEPADGKADLLLGVDPATRRTTAHMTVPAGSTLLFYTDGLVERRGQDLDQGLARLLRAVETHARADLETLCDAVLGAMVPEAGEDDVAIVAVRPGQRAGAPRSLDTGTWSAVLGGVT